MDKHRISQQQRRRLMAHGIIEDEQLFTHRRDKNRERIVHPRNPQPRNETIMTDINVQSEKTEKSSRRDSSEREPQAAPPHATPEDVIGRKLDETHRLCNELWGAEVRRSSWKGKATNAALIAGAVAVGVVAAEGALMLLVGKSAPSPIPEALPQAPVPLPKK
jgi:hypothetical protein